MELQNKHNQCIGIIANSILRLVPHLLQRNSIVLEEQEAVMTNGKFDLLDKFIDDGRVLRVQQREINRLEFGKVVLLLGGLRRNPLWHEGLAR